MRILETALYTEDLEAARDFYTGLLGLSEIAYDPARDLFLRLDGSVLILFKGSKTRRGDTGMAPHGTEGAGHAAFAATREEIEAWRKRLTEAEVPIVQEIDWGDGAHSIYFRDPAGNILEFATPKMWGLG